MIGTVRKAFGKNFLLLMNTVNAFNLHYIQKPIIVCIYFSFSGSPSFIEGQPRCPGSKAPVFNQSNSFATAPIIYLNGRSFTISCWIKQTKWSLDELGLIYGDWHDPQQFLLGTRNEKIVFSRRNNGSEEVWSLQSTNVSLSSWTHVVVTWHHDRRTVLMYADGKEIGNGIYSPGETFRGPTGKPYMIGNDGSNDSHQFYGSVMDLHVLGWALSRDEINMRGLKLMILFTTLKHFKTAEQGKIVLLNNV